LSKLDDESTYCQNEKYQACDIGRSSTFIAILWLAQIEERIYDVGQKNTENWIKATHQNCQDYAYYK